MDTDLKFVLEKLGLTKAESSVFSSLIEKGDARIGKLVKETQLHRGTVYNTLQRLMHKGLVINQMNDQVMHYRPNPQGFLSDLADERKRLQEKEKWAEEVSKRTKLAKNLVPDKHGNYNLYGKTAFKNFFLDLLQTNSKKDEKYAFLGNGGDMGDVMGLDYYRLSQEQKMALKVKCDVVMNEKSKGHPKLKFTAGNIKWVPPGYDFGKQDVWMYDGKVVIVHWDENPIRVEVKEGDGETQWHNTVFKTFWKSLALRNEEYVEHNFWKKKALI